MKARLLAFLLALFLASCGPPGVVVYERVGGTWQVKEIHLRMENINPDAIEGGREALDEIGK